MHLTVLTTAGETDNWMDVTDGILRDGILHVVRELDMESPPLWMKIVNDGERDYQLVGMYAPGMWVKVTYSRD